LANLEKYTKIFCFSSKSKTLALAGREKHHVFFAVFCHKFMRTAAARDRRKKIIAEIMFLSHKKS
jgi:hypothetical protein